MLQAKLSSKFQLSIPKALRSSLNLQAGQQFILIDTCGWIEWLTAGAGRSAFSSSRISAGLNQSSCRLQFNLSYTNGQPGSGAFKLRWKSPP